MKTYKNVSMSDINGRCPECGNRVLLFYGDSVMEKVECYSCHWTGEMNERVDTMEEYKNYQRTKTIDKMLNK